LRKSIDHSVVHIEGTDMARKGNGKEDRVVVKILGNTEGYRIMNLRVKGGNKSYGPRSEKPRRSNGRGGKEKGKKGV